MTTSDKPTTGEFSVCQFFVSGEYEYVRRHVSAQEAVKAFTHYCTSVGARMLGVVDRVIITDGGDCVSMEWKKDEGIVFPTEMRGMYKP